MVRSRPSRTIVITRPPNANGYWLKLRLKTERFAKTPHTTYDSIDEFLDGLGTPLSV